MNEPNRCFTLPNGECVSPFECPHGPPDDRAVEALLALPPNAPTSPLFARGRSDTGLIPVAELSRLLRTYGLVQLILVAWDGKNEHVATDGTTLGDADSAAAGGNMVKAALGWPAGARSVSGRVTVLVDRANELLDRLALLDREPNAGLSCAREVSRLRDLLVAEGFRS